MVLLFSSLHHSNPSHNSSRSSRQAPKGAWAAAEEAGETMEEMEEVVATMVGRTDAAHLATAVVVVEVGDLQTGVRGHLGRHVVAAEGLSAIRSMKVLASGHSRCLSSQPSADLSPGRPNCTPR